MSPNPIQAVPTAIRRWQQGPFAVFFGRYRGFAATAHAHMEGQLLLPLAGRMHLVAGGRAHILGPEGAAWLPPGLDHGFIHVDGRLDFLAVEVDPTIDGTLLQQAPGDRPLVARDAGIWWLGMAIARELDAPGADGDRLVNGLLASLFVYLERMLLPGATTPEAASQEVARVVEAILAGYAEDLRVPALADLAGLSPRQLERRFGSELGRTPKQFLTEVRVGAAGALLRSTGWPVAQIALAVGFQNPSHFAARFREITGRHPSSVRENDDG